MIITALVLALLSANSNGVQSDHEYFLVTCALFKSEEAVSGRQAHELNLLVSLKPNEKGSLRVIDTFDPSHVLPSGGFVDAFFDRSSGKTRFAAFTGSVKKPETRLLSLQWQAPSEYDAMLSDVRQKDGTFEGRCWMSNIANAAEEFEKLKVKKVSR